MTGLFVLGIVGCRDGEKEGRIARSLAALNSANVQVRANAVATLGKEQHSAAARLALINATADSAADVRGAALRALADLGMSPSTLGPLLHTAMIDAAPGVRYAAIDVLTRDRYRDASALDLLRLSLRDSTEAIRAVAAVALSRLGQRATAALGDLARAARDSNELVRHEARDAIDIITGKTLHHQP